MFSLLTFTPVHSNTGNNTNRDSHLKRIAILVSIGKGCKISKSFTIEQ